MRVCGTGRANRIEVVMVGDISFPLAGIRDMRWESWTVIRCKRLKDLHGQAIGIYILIITLVTSYPHPVVVFM